jgi:5-methylcytosine-specific restriction enzyme subunit McrC
MPKTPVSRLFFLLGFSLDPARAWRDDREGTVDTGAYDDVVPALAHAVERQIDAALRQGVLQGYRMVEESALVVRGRLREIEKSDGLLNADLYQVLAYATVLGLREAHLVYAAGRRPRRVHEIHGTATGPDGRGIRLYQHSLELSREPGQLLSTLQEIAGQLAGPGSD